MPPGQCPASALSANGSADVPGTLCASCLKSLLAEFSPVRKSLLWSASLWGALAMVAPSSARAQAPAAANANEKADADDPEPDVEDEIRALGPLPSEDLGEALAQLVSLEEVQEKMLRAARFHFDGDAYMMRSEFEAAMLSYEDAMRILPTDRRLPTRFEEAQRLHKVAKKDAEEKLQLAQQEQAEIMYTTGLRYFKEGRIDDSVLWFQSAHQTNRIDPKYRDSLEQALRVQKGDASGAETSSVDPDAAATARSTVRCSMPNCWRRSMSN